MNCASCGRTNRDGARFCGGCGGSLAPRCPACGAVAEPDARFCDACGAAMSARPAEQGVQRKVVTIVFADLIGSTALHEGLDPESVRRIMEGYHGSVRVPVEAHGGTVVQLLGDGVMCAFGIPRVAEDDALRAVRAAMDVQRAFREFLHEHPELADRVGLRVAVNTGEVVVSDDYAAGIGDPLNVAARLQQEARDGDVLIGGATQRFVAEQVTLEHVGSFALKGRAEPVAAYRVVSLDPPERATATRFVGRDSELRRLTALYDAAVAAPAARLALLLGSPGLGKSRLLSEVSGRLGDRATVLSAQCVASVGATFAPLNDALRAALDAAPPGDPAERARIEAGIGALLAGTPASPEETFFVVRRLLAALATKQPVVLVIDDLQWAEPLLLDLTEHLVQWGAGVPLLVLAAARPELRDVRSSLTSAGGVVSEVVTLAGLDAGAATQLAASLIGAEELPAAIAGRVLATSEGNPLFLGELVRMLVNDGALKREGERWTVGVEVAKLDMPPTIQALLAARIERLRPEDRIVLERASVIGRQFSRAALAHLLPQGALADLDARLEGLRRSELIEPDSGWLLGEPMLRFHHSLVRDAAYRRLLKNARAELHTRFAEWLEGQAGETALHEETLGWHLEQAHQHLSEIGPLDANGRALGERAARYLASAGRRALARDDLPPAGSLLGRALACLDASDPARAELALDWCEALLSAGDVVPAARALEELERFAEGSDRLRAWHTCFSGQLNVLTDPQALRTSIEAVAAAAETLAAAGDAAGEAKAYWVHAIALSRLGQMGACEAALDRALAAARRVRGDRRRANAVLSGAPLAALWGPSPVTRASGRCLDVVRVLRITQGAPAVEAVALRCQAVLETLRGRADAARRMLASSRRMVEELGITQRLLEADMFAGLIELLEGDAASAERYLRTAYEGLRTRGLGIDAAQAAALLGRTLLAQDRAAEAETLSHESEALAGDDLKAAIAWRGVRAEALARRGETQAAIDLARQAVEIAAATDALLDHADARQALAAALRAAGRAAEADAEEQRAIELWEAKGATLLAERVRRDVGHDVRVDYASEVRTSPAVRARRRVRANAATGNVARLQATITARNSAALETLLAADFESIHHPTGSVSDGTVDLAVFRELLRAYDPHLEIEALATLGDSLALCRQIRSFSALADGEGIDVGPAHSEQLALVETDAQEQARRVEMWEPERLADAIARLYERYAESLPDRAERTRATMTARAVALLVEPLDVAAIERILAPDVEFVDHRQLGFEATSGAAASLENLRSLAELTSDSALRIHEVLVLEPGALLFRATIVGTERAGGGAFERPLLALRIFGADGRLARLEHFDADRSGEALARFDELMGAGSAPRVQRRVRPNAATANAVRMDAAVMARDEAAIANVFASDLETVYHPTGITYDRQGALDRFHSLMGAREVVHRHEPLATLGDSLALTKLGISYAGIVVEDLDIGAVEREDAVLLEVDAQGKRRRSEIFTAERLGAAIVRLYERYAALQPEGEARARGGATARTVTAMLEQPDLERWRTVFAPDIEFVDARSVGFGSIRGASAVLDGIRALFDLASEFVTRVDDVLCAAPGALLVRWMNSGTLRDGGGSFERDLCQLWLFAADGRLARWEQFDGDRSADALVRFDALAAARPTRRVQPNAATTNAARMDAAVAARDIDALYAVFADGARSTHRPTGTEYAEHEARGAFRAMLAAEQLVFEHETLATLGESLALQRGLVRFAALETGAASIGATNNDSIVLMEVDARGLRIHTEFFATDKLGAAIVRLYERYAERLPDDEKRVRAAAMARAVSAGIRVGELTGAIAPDIEFVDHRPLGIGSGRGAEQIRRSRGVFDTLTEDLAIQVHDVLALTPRGYLVPWTTSGRQAAGGGVFENHFLMLRVYTPEGLLRHIEWFEVDRVAEALARFDELTAEPAQRIENAATRSAERFDAAWEARDWDRVAALFGPGYHESDRRKAAQVELDREHYLAGLRLPFGLAASAHPREVLATRGDRLALFRTLFRGAGGDIGPTELEWLGLTEVDERGLRTSGAMFDADDIDAAAAELDARYAAGEAAAHPRVSAATEAFRAAFARRDWEAVAAQYVPDVVVHDHRLLGWEPIHGTAAYVESLRTLVELAPDARIQSDHIALNERGLLWVARWAGTREGGPFESPWIVVSEHDASGRVQRFDTYDLDQLDAARARFEELRPDPLRIPPNAATRLRDRAGEAIARGDFEALRALASPDFRYEDRTRRSLVSGDIEVYVTSLGFAAAALGVRVECERVATLGERLALERVRYFGTSGGVEFEKDLLRLTEIDAEGRLLASLSFDPDERRAAGQEMVDRYYRGEGARWVTPSFVEFLGAVKAHDPVRVRAALPDDFVFHDRRRTGLGRLDVEDYIASLAAIWELSSDWSTDILYYVAVEAHASLDVGRNYGTLASGGEYESPFARLVLRRNGEFVGAELFELEDLDRARARFEELRPDPLRIPPNAATRAADRVREQLATGDWPALRDLTTPGFVFDDRRKRALVSGDVELYVRNLQVVRSYPNLKTTLELLGTAGDRVSIARLAYTGGPEGSAFEGEFLLLSEVDAAGRVCTVIHFDFEDRNAAFADAQARFVAGEAAGGEGQAAIAAFTRAYAQNDWKTTRGHLADDFVLHDHRTLGLGTLGRDEWIESLRVMADLAPGWSAETVRLLAWNRHGRVDVTRHFGTTRDGGPFENIFVRVMVTDGDRIQRNDTFDVGDGERALARFEELTAR